MSAGQNPGCPPLRTQSCKVPISFEKSVMQNGNFVGCLLFELRKYQRDVELGSYYCGPDSDCSLVLFSTLCGRFQ